MLHVIGTHLIRLVSRRRHNNRIFNFRNSRGGILNQLQLDSCVKILDPANLAYKLSAKRYRIPDWVASIGNVGAIHDCHRVEYLDGCCVDEPFQVAEVADGVGQGRSGEGEESYWKN